MTDASQPTLMCRAVRKLRDAQKQRRSLVSVGLEPCPEYLPAGFSPTIADYERFLHMIIAATSGLVCAYKFNLAFFEALGPEGTALLYRVRAALPDDVLIIADAKRCDIGSSARRYAEALYARLGADAATVNPMLGRDSVEPFLAHSDRLTFFLVLTSNPGANDFLIPEGLHRRLAQRLIEWDSTGSAGFVVGATRGEGIGEVRALAPNTPFLVPGLGAQEGDAQAVLRHGAAQNPEVPGLVVHVTRGILPGPDDRDLELAIHRRTQAFRDQLRN